MLCSPLLRSTEQSRIRAPARATRNRSSTDWVTENGKVSSLSSLTKPAAVSLQLQLVSVVAVATGAAPDERAQGTRRILRPATSLHRKDSFWPPSTCDFAKLNSSTRATTELKNALFKTTVLTKPTFGAYQSIYLRRSDRSDWERFLWYTASVSIRMQLENRPAGTATSSVSKKVRWYCMTWNAPVRWPNGNNELDQVKSGFKSCGRNFFSSNRIRSCHQRIHG